MSDPVEEARDRVVDALVDWSALPLGVGQNVHDILDDFEEAIRAEAVREWETAVRELMTEYDAEEEEYGFPFNFGLRQAHARLRALLPESTAPQEERA